MSAESRVVIVGGGPGGYEAALVASAEGAQVTVVDRDGVGGACVLTDCVPSKALISAASYYTRDESPHALDLALINNRILTLADRQSTDIRSRLETVGVRVITGTATLRDATTVRAVEADGSEEELPADCIIIATGATPRVMPTAQPDGERILTWKQIFALPAMPEHLIVVGSGVTGAELAQAYLGLGGKVTLVSSRERVLPGEDQDAAELIEGVFRDRGMTVLGRSRMAGVETTDDGVVVRLEDGREVHGSHALLAVGSIPVTQGLGLEEAGVELTKSGHIVVDRVSRTSVRGIYASGDCTGVLPLASVAAMQGRIAIAHHLGGAVVPLEIKGVSANIFTDPEIATVGISQVDASEQSDVIDVLMPLAPNARAKMDNITEGFVKLFARRGSHQILGGVVVAPRASELIFPIALTVGERLTLEQLASTITVYPSLSGSIAEAARRLRASDHAT